MIGDRTQGFPYITIFSLFSIKDGLGGGCLDIGQLAALWPANNVAPWCNLRSQRIYISTYGLRRKESTRRALVGSERVLGADHPNRLTSVYCLAICSPTSHCYDESLRLYDRAIVGYSKVIGLEHPTTKPVRSTKHLLLRKWTHGS